MEKNVRMKTLFYVTFKDGSVFYGGENYNDTGWKEMPDKPIERIIYRLPFDAISLYGYDKYYHLVEATRDINGKDAGISKLEYAYLMGKKEKEIIVYRIALCNKGQNKQNPIENHEIGDIKVLHTTIDNEWIKSLSKEGWK